MWLSADPLAEKYPGFNPFNYCINNPLRLVDPIGMEYTPADEERDKQLQTTFDNLGGFDFGDPDGKKKENKNQGVNGASYIDPNSMVENILTQLKNAFWNGAVESVDKVSEGISNGSNYATAALFVGGFFTEGATWALLPSTSAIGTGADVVSATAKTVKAVNGTGTLGDAVGKYTEIGINAIGGTVLKGITQSVARPISFVRYGKFVTQYVGSNGRFVTNGLGKFMGAVKDATAVPLSLGGKEIGNMATEYINNKK